MAVSYTATRAKIGRGRHHIEQLEPAIQEYLKSRPVITVGFERSAGQQFQFTMRSVTVRELPLDIVMIFGDAVHNIRAALDWLVHEVVAQRTRPALGLAFPFASRAEGIGKAIREKMKDTTAAERNLVRELKPFSGGNELLWSLHQLDLQDKHRTPLEVSTQVTSAPMSVAGAPNAPRLIQQSRLSPIPQEFAAHFVPPAGFECIGVLDDATREVVIAEGLPLAERNAILALTEIADAVEEVVSRFEALSTA